MMEYVLVSNDEVKITYDESAREDIMKMMDWTEEELISNEFKHRFD